MKVIGLTGGIGSGKSRVASVLTECFKAEVIYTDEVAKKQMRKGQCSYEAVVKEFGEEILNSRQQIDRKKLSKLVFAEKEKLERLNALTHPNVLEFLSARRKELEEKQNQKLLVIETALLIEAGYAAFCDEVFYVFASEADRRQRLIENRGYTEERVAAIFAAQKSEKEFLSCSTATIYHGNEVTLTELFHQIQFLLDRK